MSGAERGSKIEETQALIEALSDSGRGVLDRALTAALARSVSYLGQEHLLYGLLEDEEVLEVFRGLEVDSRRIQAALDFITGSGDESFIGPLRFGPGALKSLSLASDFSSKSQRDKVDSTDILYGVVAEGESLGAGILDSLNLDQRRLIGHMQTQE